MPSERTPFPVFVFFIGPLAVAALAYLIDLSVGGSGVMVFAPKRGYAFERYSVITAAFCVLEASVAAFMLGRRKRVAGLIAVSVYLLLVALIALQLGSVRV